MFSKNNRLEKKFFSLVFKKGKRACFPCFNILALKSGEFDSCKIGIVVSSKVSKKSVLRNKVKRRTRAVFRKILPRLNKNHAIIIIFKKTNLELPFKIFEEEILNAIEKMNLYDFEL